MAVFADSSEIYEVLGTLYERIKKDPAMSPQLVKTKLVIQFRYRDPEAVFTIDCSDGEHFNIIEGPTDVKPTIEMQMKSDVAHEFWMGRISAPVAILTGKIVSKGPTPKALALLPIIRPAFTIYPRILEESGKKSLLKK
jgi:hypothetical protein